MTRFDDLLDGYLHNKLSEEELEEFLALVKKDTSLLKDPLLEDLQEDRFAGLLTGAQKDRIWNGVLQRTGEKRAARVIPIRLGAVAAILLLACMGIYLLTQRREPWPGTAYTVKTGRFDGDVAPGHNGAVLILSNGRQLILDSTADGSLGRQGSAQLVKRSGQIAYNIVGDGTRDEAGQEILYNTVSTPRGRQFQLLLADGTRVWLNAASSIRYPTVFAGKDRQVAITGEVYFEVARDATRPFRVEVNTPDGQREEVQVLGTTFNVNAYEDDATIRTTLLEGGIRVGDALLKPGQQAVLQGSGAIHVRNDADLEETMAWKNGIFEFGDASIETIMKQAARWYDADIVYEGRIPYSFVATISRDVPISKLLLLLELTGKVHFRIEGRKIIVMP